MQTVFVIAVNRFLRESLLALFRRDKGSRVVGAAAFSPLIAERVAQLRPDIVALNPEPDGRAFGATRAIHQAAPQSKILMIGMPDDRESFLQAVRAGALGYLLADSSPRRILAAARRLALSSVVCPPHLLCALLQSLADSPDGHACRPEPASELTPRERQLAALLVQGLANKEIAQRLNLSLGTVKCHVHSILHKTQSKSRVGVAQWAEPRPWAAPASCVAPESLQASA